MGDQLGDHRIVVHRDLVALVHARVDPHGAWLRFRNGQTAYTLYTGIGKWGPKGATQEKQGLAVERGGKLVANLKCNARPVSLLGPDWFEKVGVKDAGEDFDIPD